MLGHSCPMDMPVGNSCTTFDPFRPDIYRHSIRFVPMHPLMGHNIPWTQVCMFPCQLTPHMFPPHTCHRRWLNHSSLCVPFWHAPWHKYSSCYSSGPQSQCNVLPPLLSDTACPHSCPQMCSLCTHPDSCCKPSLYHQH